MDKRNNHSSKQQALKYLDEYDIEVVINEMLNSLVHDKPKHPYVYMIKYLAGLMMEEERREYNLNIPEPYPIARPSVRYPKLDPVKSSALKSYLTKEEWEKIRHIKTKHGNNINSLTKLTNHKPSDKIGCILSDGDCLNAYPNLVNSVICSVHHISSSDLMNLKEYQLRSITSIKPYDFPLSLSATINQVKKLTLSFNRNITDYPFNHFSSGTNKLAAVESLLVKTITSLCSDGNIPECSQFKVNEADALLDYIDFDMEWLTEANLKQGWPNSRAVFATKDKSIIILINFSDHLQLCITHEHKDTNESKIDIPLMYNTAMDILKQIELVVGYESSLTLGYLTTNFNLIGAGYTMISTLSFNKLHEKKYNKNIKIEDIVKGMLFDSYFFDNDENSKLITMQSCKLSDGNEIEFMMDYLSKISGLIQLDTTDDDSTVSFDKIQFKHSSQNNYEDKALIEVYNSLYEKMKYHFNFQGFTLNNLLKYTSMYPLDGMGLIVHDISDYFIFYSFFQKYIQTTQGFNINTTDHIHKPDEPKKMIELPKDEMKKISNITISLIRNIEGKHLPHIKEYQENETVVDVIENVIETLNLKGHFANYYQLNNEEGQKMMKENNFPICHNDHMNFDDKYIFKGMDCDYPANRGLIKFTKDNLFALVNDFDHIKFILSIKELKDKLDTSLVSLLKIVNEFSKQIVFSYNKKYGFFTSNPRFIGTGLDIQLEMKIEKRSKEELLEWLKELKNSQFDCLIIDSTEQSKDKSYQVKIRNKISIGLSETELFTNLLIFLNEILIKDQ